MLIGPVFIREVRTAPRGVRHYVGRSVYPLALLVLAGTAWLVLTGTQIVRNTGDFARFGSVLFQILAPLQLALAVFFSALLAASAVAQEKDRRTFELLLMSRLSNAELVLGRLLASLLNVIVLWIASWPMFAAVSLFGGVSADQILRALAITLGAILTAGSLGSLIGLWRDKTFQTVALTAVILVLWIFAWEAVSLGFTSTSWLGHSAGDWAAAMSPWRAVVNSTSPQIAETANAHSLPDWFEPFVPLSLLITLVLNGVAVWRVRAWNPSQEVRGRSRPRPSLEAAATGHAGPARDTPTADQTTLPAPAVHAVPRATRSVWPNPVLWRELRTWAYGRRMLIVRLAYLVLFAAATASLVSLVGREANIARAQLALPLTPLLLLSLVLVNAQAVTSITSEKDGRTFDVLLATDLTPKEFIFGKLAGAFYNTKEMWGLPLFLGGYLWLAGIVSLENTLYLFLGLLVLYAFVATLGLHSGMTYDSSRHAVAVSLGTVFFLFVGVATSMRVMLAFSGTFEVQLQIFWPLTLGGGIGLYFALGWRNPSTAIGIASLVCPFATFFAITSFLLGYTLQVFLVVVATYGFATAAMLIPAVQEFDVATGRTSASGT